jgi:hypothetical protein
LFGGSYVLDSFDYALVLEVKSIGPLGEAYAAGWVVIDLDDEEEVASGSVAIPLDDAFSLEEIVAGEIGDYDCNHRMRERLTVSVEDSVQEADSPQELRSIVWDRICYWTGENAAVVAYQPFPVAASLLIDAVKDQTDRYEGLPKITDLKGMLEAANLPFVVDPVAGSPVADARGYANLLKTALRVIDMDA